MNDVATVMWKEWREIKAQSEFSPATVRIAAIVLALVIGGVAALGGPSLLRTPITFVAVWAPLIGVMSTICESFAGERERHTLETLLASRLSSESLLAGKIAVHVVYGWAMALALVFLFTLGANALTLKNGFVLPPAAVLYSVLVLTPLLIFVLAAAGVLVSLRAPTVRVAQARLVSAFMLIFITIALTSLLMPRSWKEAAKAPHTMAIALGAWTFILLAADVALLLAAYARFQRDKLIGN
jgi:ABC-2 type transport system permease protein